MFGEDGCFPYSKCDKQSVVPNYLKYKIRCFKKKHKSTKNLVDLQWKI